MAVPYYYYIIFLLIIFLFPILFTELRLRLNIKIITQNLGHLIGRGFNVNNEIMQVETLKKQYYLYSLTKIYWEINEVVITLLNRIILPDLASKYTLRERIFLNLMENQDKQVNVDPGVLQIIDKLFQFKIINEHGKLLIRGHLKPIKLLYKNYIFFSQRGRWIISDFINSISGKIFVIAILIIIIQVIFTLNGLDLLNIKNLIILLSILLLISIFLIIISSNISLLLNNLYDFLFAVFQTSIGKALYIFFLSVIIQYGFNQSNLFSILIIRSILTSIIGVAIWNSLNIYSEHLRKATLLGFIYTLIALVVTIPIIMVGSDINNRIYDYRNDKAPTIHSIAFDKDCYEYDKYNDECTVYSYVTDKEDRPDKIDVDLRIERKYWRDPSNDMTYGNYTYNNSIYNYKGIIKLEQDKDDIKKYRIVVFAEDSIGKDIKKKVDIKVQPNKPPRIDNVDVSDHNVYIYVSDPDDSFGKLDVEVTLKKNYWFDPDYTAEYEGNSKYSVSIPDDELDPKYEDEKEYELIIKVKDPHGENDEITEVVIISPDGNRGFWDWVIVVFTVLCWIVFIIVIIGVSWYIYNEFFY